MKGRQLSFGRMAFIATAVIAVGSVSLGLIVRLRYGTVLCLATAERLDRTVRALLALGADPNGPGRGGRTPLMYAIASGERHTVRAILAAGADVNRTDEIGATALYDSIVASDSATVQLLLSRGASVDVRQRGGVSPLMVAAMKGTDSTLVLLLRAGANPDEMDEKGRTARDYFTGNSEDWGRLLASVRRP